MNSTMNGTANGTAKPKLTKNQKRRQKKKLKKGQKSTDENSSHSSTKIQPPQADVEVEYVSDRSMVAAPPAPAPAPPPVPPDPHGAGIYGPGALQPPTPARQDPPGDPVMDEFRKIFEHFSTAEELCGRDEEEEQAGDETKGGEGGVPPGGAAGLLMGGLMIGQGLTAFDIDDEPKEDDPAGVKKLSRKARKRLNRLSVAELKQLVQRPDVVEAHDVTAADPRLLVFLKAHRNTVAVPRHWSHKRKYLQGKRGIDKKPFALPDFIAQTGIEKIRNSVEELDAMKRAKQRMRERVNPKMGKIDIDYQVLHDAFFKWQTKPSLTRHGDLYYEGKEFEVNYAEKRPGVLTDDLKKALGMPENAPPPWLINMQRYGPPPSYPNLKLPGLNAPIPEGASFGYHPGGWGKPPVDETGKPLYGNVFGGGMDDEYEEDRRDLEEMDKAHWGELEESDEEEDYEDEDEDEEEVEADDTSGIETPLDEGGLSSVTSGLETPDAIDLRKRAGVDTPETPLSAVPPSLYKVVEQRETGVGGGLFGADKKYMVPGMGGDIQVALNPDQLEEQLGDEDILKEKYEIELEAKRSEREDVSDIMAEESRKRKRKMDKSKDAKSKKFKDFKF